MLKNTKYLLLILLIVPTLSNASIDILKQPDLKLGNTNSFVKQLQTLFNTNGFIINNKSGQPGSQGFETNYFGEKTKQAIINFQNKYNIIPASGYFGLKTKAKLFSLLKDKTWGEISKGKPVSLTVDSKSNQGVVTFGYERSNEDIKTGFPIGHGLPNVRDYLFSNLRLDGYGGLPPGSCVRRGYLLSDSDPTKPICTANENQDILRTWWSYNDLQKNVLIKNVEIKNAFRSYNYTDGTVIKSSADLPHTDTFQSYHGGVNSTSDKLDPNWLVIQDSIIKNSDNSNMILGNTRWKGFVYQNLNSGSCEDWFIRDANARIDNDYTQFNAPAGTAKYPYFCTHAIGSDSYYYAPTWLINVNTNGSAVGIDANGGAPAIVVGSNKDTLQVNLYRPAQQTNKICRYSYIEDALADTDVSDGCGNYEKPPFLELSCSGWRTAPAGCESRQGYLGGNIVITPPTTSTPATYTLTTSTTNGTISKSVNSTATTSTSFTSGTQVVLTTIPASGYQFSSWTGCSSTTNTCTVTMDSNKTVYANFISITTQPPSNSDWTYIAREDQSFTVDPNTTVRYGAGTSWETKVVSGTGQCTNVFFGRDPIIATIKTCEKSNSIVSPTTYTITASKTGTGTGSIIGISQAITTLNQGDSLTLTAEAGTNSTFTGWSGDCSGTASCVISNIQSNKVVSANFNTTLSPQFSSGNRIKLKSNTNVRSSPTLGGSTNLLGVQSASSTGTISSNPFVADGVVWYMVDYDSGVDGYSGQDNFELFTSVVTSADDDNDKISNTIDKCPNTPLNMPVNNYGCPLPTTTNLKSITNLMTSDITNISNFEITDKNSVYGKIRYDQNVNIFGTWSKNTQVNLDNYIQIQDKKVTVRSDLAPQFNKPATITLYGVTYTRPKINRDSTTYANSTSTKIISYNKSTGTLVFTVNGFSTYSVVEDTDSYTDIVNNNSSYDFVTNLRLSMRHPDVKLLQQFLNNNGYTISASGTGSKGNESDYFGLATQKALIRYQIDNNISPATGFFGPTTREKVNGGN